MDTNLKGNIGEANALKYFITNGYEVYLPFGTASKCDMVVIKENTISRVSIKTTSKFIRGKYRVKISQGKLNKVEPFDKNSSDLLFVYVLPLDKCIIYDSKSIVPKFELTVLL